MQLVFTHPDPMVVAQYRSALQRAGITVVLRNEFAMGAVGELAPIDAWQEIWVLRDRDAERAREILETSRQDITAEDLHCDSCQASSPATFEICWQCGSQLPSAGAH